MSVSLIESDPDLGRFSFQSDSCSRTACQIELLSTLNPDVVDGQCEEALEVARSSPEAESPSGRLAFYPDSA